MNTTETTKNFDLSHNRSFKNFEYMKYINETILQDDVLWKFIEKTQEFEKAAGVKQVSEKKLNTVKTVSELAKEAAAKNPHRFYTVTRFEHLIGQK